MGGAEGWGSNRAQYTKASRTANPNIEPDEDSHSKYVTDTRRQPTLHQSEVEDPEVSLLLLVRPSRTFVFSPQMPSVAVIRAMQISF